MKTGIVAWAIRKAFFKLESVLYRMRYLQCTHLMTLNEGSRIIVDLEDEVGNLKDELHKQHVINYELKNGRA